LSATTVSAVFRVRVVLPTSDVGPYEMGELLYELPGVSRARPWEPLLDDLDGFDSQGKIGGDPEYLLVGGGTS